MGQRKGICSSSCICNEPVCYTFNNSWHFICRGTTGRNWQPLKLQWANVKESAADAAAYASGQREQIGSFCSCICSRPARMNRQQLQLHMKRANTNKSAASAA